MELTEHQQDAIVLEHRLMLDQQRDVMARSTAMMARMEMLQPAAPAADSNTHGVGLIFHRPARICKATVPRTLSCTCTPSSDRSSADMPICDTMPHDGTLAFAWPPMATQ